MGRINRWSEAALKSAVEMLATTNDQKFKANLIRTILDYEVRQQERAESNKAARRKRAENTELAELRSKVAELSAQVDSAKISRAEEISKLRACLQETDRIVGLELGADDYLTKPFSPRELAVRVRNLLRRAARPSLESVRGLEFGDVEINAVTREVRKGGGLLKLTLKEFDLLLFLAAHPRRVFTRHDLMDRVWGYRSALDTGTVTVHIRRLREKIEDDPARPLHLETVWGVGYRFRP